MRQEDAPFSRCVGVLCHYELAAEVAILMMGQPSWHVNLLI